MESSGARAASTPAGSITSIKTPMTAIRDWCPLRRSHRQHQPDPDHQSAADEIYNLGAQSHVAVSFESPEYTANSDALGTLRILEAARIQGLAKTRIYQASTSELYGLVHTSEEARLYPRSPWCRQALCLLDHCQLPRAGCMPAMEFCLTTKVRGRVKRL